MGESYVVTQNNRPMEVVRLFLVTRQLELITRYNWLLWGLRCPFSSTEGVGTKSSSMQQRRKWVWKPHPHSKGLPYHWTNERSKWYLMLSGRLLTQWRLYVMACNIWSIARLPGSRLQSSVGWLLRKSDDCLYDHRVTIGSFRKTPLVLWGFWNNWNQWFFDSDYFSSPKQELTVLCKNYTTLFWTSCHRYIYATVLKTVHNPYIPPLL